MPNDFGLNACRWFASHRENDTAFVNLFSEIGIGEPVEKLIEQIGAVPRVSIAIDSIGGCSHAAWKLFAALAGRTVETQVTGNCFSCAVIPFLAGSRRRIASTARMMLHPAKQFCFGNGPELEFAGQQVSKLNARLAALIAGATGLPASVCAEWTSGPDFYFDAPEALRLGLATEVYSPPVATPTAADGPTATPSGPTPDEALFQDWLRAFGTVTVRDRLKFSHALQSWFATAVRET